MGNIIYRRITNVYDIPPDILVECIGKGLVVRRSTEEISSENCENHDHTEQVPCSLEIDLGSGLAFNCDNKLEVDTTPVTTQVLTNLTDVSMSIEGQKLTLTKTFTDYTVKKTESGLVVDIEVGECRTVTEDILLLDYGYCGTGTPARMSTPALPNFYQK